MEPHMSPRTILLRYILPDNNKIIMIERSNSTTRLSPQSIGLPTQTGSSPLPKTGMRTFGTRLSMRPVVLLGNLRLCCCASTGLRLMFAGVPTKTSLQSLAVLGKVLPTSIDLDQANLLLSIGQLLSAPLIPKTIGGLRNISRNLSGRLCSASIGIPTMFYLLLVAQI